MARCYIYFGFLFVNFIFTVVMISFSEESSSTSFPQLSLDGAEQNARKAEDDLFTWLAFGNVDYYPSSEVLDQLNRKSLLLFLERASHAFEVLLRPIMRQHAYLFYERLDELKERIKWIK